MKNLHRSNRNQMLAGVCGGIGEYFGIDPKTTGGDRAPPLPVIAVPSRRVNIPKAWPPPLLFQRDAPWRCAVPTAEAPP